MIKHFAAALLLAAGVQAAEPPKLPQDLQSLYDLAQATPPEFNADALMRLAATDKLKDKTAKENLVEQAFHLAASAQFRLPMRAMPGDWADTRQGLLPAAY